MYPETSDPVAPPDSSKPFRNLLLWGSVYLPVVGGCMLYGIKLLERNDPIGIYFVVAAATVNLVVALGDCGARIARRDTRGAGWAVSLTGGLGSVALVGITLWLWVAALRDGWL